METHSAKIFTCDYPTLADLTLSTRLFSVFRPDLLYRKFRGFRMCFHKVIGYDFPMSPQSELLPCPLIFMSRLVTHPPDYLFQVTQVSGSCGRIISPCHSGVAITPFNNEEGTPRSVKLLPFLVLQEYALNGLHRKKRQEHLV